MFGYVLRGLRKAAEWTVKTVRKVLGIGKDFVPDAVSVFTISSRIAVVALGTLALIATIIPALSADPVAIRLLGASRSLWEAGTQAGYESRYTPSLRERMESRGFSVAGRRSVDVYSLGGDDDDDDNLPQRRW